jgi:hypothetical protein
MFWATESTPKYNHTLKIVYKSGNVETIRCQAWEVKVDADANISAFTVSGIDRKKVYWGLNNIESIWEV